MAVKDVVPKNWTITPSDDGRRWSVWPDGDRPSDQFPLAVHGSGRYLVDAQGTPYLLHGDTPWSLASSLTDAEVDSYIDDRAAKGFTAIMIEAPVFHFTPDGGTNNVDGVAPFTSMSGSWNWVLNNTYWTRVDRIVNRCKTNGIVVILNPAYVGWATGAEGCSTQLTATSAGVLQAYGASLATRYTQGNIIWCMGGDWHEDATLNAKQWNIITGIRSVRTTDLVTAHSGPAADSLDGWSSFTGSGLNLNFCYPETGDIYSECLTSYGKAMAMFMGEAIYEQERSPPINAAGLRRQSYQALLSGACGQFFGNSPIWHFESPNGLFSYTGTWESNLDSTGSVQQQYVKALFGAFQWWKLEPKTDSTLVSSSLSSGSSRICPALASDGSFGLIWVPSSQSVTVVKSALTPSLIRIRLYDTTDGSYSTHTASTANTGTISVATGGERVIVLDAA